MKLLTVFFLAFGLAIAGEKPPVEPEQPTLTTDQQLSLEKWQVENLALQLQIEKQFGAMINKNKSDWETFKLTACGPYFEPVRHQDGKWICIPAKRPQGK